MDKLIKKAEVLIEALPYIQSFYEKTIVIKYGGSAMTDPDIRRRALQDIVFMNYVGMRPIIVHGGGPFINKLLEKDNKKVQFVEGFRVTDEETIQTVEEALTDVNKDIVRELTNLGCSAISLSGKDDHLIMAKKHGQINGVDIGYVGDVTRINADVLLKLVTSDIIPVISPIGVGKDGYTYNVNADTSAAEIAKEVRALKFVLLTDVDGICRDAQDFKSLIPHIQLSEVDKLIADQVISGGMIPKVRACSRAVEKGVKKAHIINGKTQHGLLLEIFTDQGIGTEIVKK